MLLFVDNNLIRPVQKCRVEFFPFSLFRVVLFFMKSVVLRPVNSPCIENIGRRARAVFALIADAENVQTYLSSTATTSFP